MNTKEIIEQTVGFDERLRKIAVLIENADRIAVLGHTDPDMDCIGSQLALVKGLEQRGKQAIPVNCGAFDRSLAEYEPLFTDHVPDDFDLIIVVDNSSIDRISSRAPIDLSKTVVIDHHFTNTGYGVVNYVDDYFISASEMVFLLLIYLDTDFDDTELTQIILNGILADNGYYRHIRTDKFFSLLSSYLLIKLGGDPKKSYDRMFCNNSAGDIKLLGTVLERIEAFHHDTVLATFITEADKDIYHGEISSGLLFKEMMSIKTGRIFIFFKVVESENKVIVSFRSDDLIDVGSLAQELGGGGHRVAAGAGVTGSYEEVRDTVLGLVEKLL